MSQNNFYKILNNFNKVAQEPQQPATQQQQPKAKTKLQENMEQVLTRKLIAEKKAKPDYIDLDKDGNKKESMKKAAKDAKKVEEGMGCMDETDYSAKKARAGKDIGKPGKNFAKIAKGAAERYGSKERGEKVAGAVLAKLRAKESVEEVAPPGAKAERMVKHIKKSYAKDGKLTPKEKGIAYATAWKAHNKGKVEETIKAMFDAGYSREQIVEGWEEMMKDVEKRHKEEKGTGKFDKKKTDKGTKYTRKYDAKSGESEDTGKDGEGKEVKKKRGRPKKVNESYTTATKMIAEAFRGMLEGSIQQGVWTAKPGNVPVPTDPEMAKPTSKAAPAAKPAADMGSAAKAMMAPNVVDPKAKVIPSDPEGVKEDDMEEGNAFSGALAKARADGVQPGEKMKVGDKEYPVKEEEDLDESLNQMRRIAGLPVVEAKAEKKADKDYDGDGKVESGKDEYLGSKIAAAKKAGKLKEGEMCSKCDCDPCECDDKEKVDECMSPLGNAAQEMQDSQGKMNINTSMDSDGHKSVTITADGDAAGELMQMLKLAGMGGGEQTSMEPQGEPEGVMVVAQDDEGEEEQEVDEEKDPRYQASTTPDEHVMPTQVQTKGGDGDVAGKEKQMHKHGYKFADNPMAMHENATLKLMKEYESIKAKK